MSGTPTRSLPPGASYTIEQSSGEATTVSSGQRIHHASSSSLPSTLPSTEPLQHQQQPSSPSHSTTQGQQPPRRNSFMASSSSSTVSGAQAIAGMSPPPPLATLASVPEATSSASNNSNGSGSGSNGGGGGQQQRDEGRSSSAPATQERTQHAPSSSLPAAPNSARPSPSLRSPLPTPPSSTSTTSNAPYSVPYPSVQSTSTTPRDSTSPPPHGMPTPSPSPPARVVGPPPTSSQPPPMTQNRPPTLLPTPPTPPHTIPTPIRRDTSQSLTSQSQDHPMLPLQFSPIPSHLDPTFVSSSHTNAANEVEIMTTTTSRERQPASFNGGAPSPSSSSSPIIPRNSPTTTRDRASSSSIPSFIPAAAFSADDRGPYPPMNTRVNGTGGGGGTSFDQGFPINLSPGGINKGKGRDDDGSSFPASPIEGGGARNSLFVRTTTRNSVVGGGGNISSPSSPFQLQQQQFLNPSSPSTQVATVGPITSPPPPPPQQRPPHLVPQPEVCVECMMRDRDMVDVDVTGEGVWSRESDTDFEEAMRWEAEDGGGGGGGGTSNGGDHWKGSEESVQLGGGGGRGVGRSGGSSRESGGGRSSAYGHAGGAGRKRLGKGQPLTSSSLKIWTNMNPPASSHRWRTLQGFLATQNHLIELERQAREHAAEQQQQQARAVSPNGTLNSLPSPRPGDVRQSAPALMSTTSRNSRNSTLLPNGYPIDSSSDRTSRAQSRPRQSTDDLSPTSVYRNSSASLQPYAIPSTGFNPAHTGSPAPSVRSYSYGDQPWLSAQPRRFSNSSRTNPTGKENGGYNVPPSPGGGSGASLRSLGGAYSRTFSNKFGARSSTDLRSIASPRSVSPARTSLGVDERRTSMWSRFRQSASQSVLSFAPSGSMMDMHLGLSMDKHAAHAPYETYPLAMSDPDVARRQVDTERHRVLEQRGAPHQQHYSADDEPPPERKPKKKGIKGFFSKLTGSKNDSSSSNKKNHHHQSASAPTTPHDPMFYDPNDDELAPPPPLSALANEPRYHNRSSTSSVDSFGGPYTPPPQQQGSSFRLSGPGIGLNTSVGGGGGGGGGGDRGSIMTMGSYNSSRSKRFVQNGGGGMNGGGGGGGGPSLRRPSNDSLDPTLVFNRTGSPEPYSSSFLDVERHQPHPLNSNNNINADTEVLDASFSSPRNSFIVPGPSPPIHLSQFQPPFIPSSTTTTQPRLQKSLPCLPSEAATYAHQQALYYSHPSDQLTSYPFPPPPPPAPLSPPNMPYSNHQASRSAYSVQTESLGGGRKSKAKSKVFSMGFGLKKSKNGSGREGGGQESVSVRY